MIDLKLFASTFVLIFLAELGDKTQLATFCLAAKDGSRISVFLGAAGALFLTSLIAVGCGFVVGNLIPQQYLRLGAGFIFLIFGILMLFSK